MDLIRVNPHVSAGNPRRRHLSLLSGHTGVPVVTLWLDALSERRTWYLSAAEDVDAIVCSLQSEPSRAEVSSLKHFFDAGGSFLILSALPLRGFLALDAILGGDQGLRQRTGIHTVKDFTDEADLVLFPQISRDLAPEEYRLFCNAVMDLPLDASRMLFLIDSPTSLSSDQLFTWSKSLSSPDAVLLFPPLTDGCDTRASSLIAALLFQLNDRSRGMQHLPANLPVASQLRPLRSLSHFEISQCLAHRTSVLVEESGKIVLWGGRTLALPTDPPEKTLIAMRRASLAVRDSIETLCEGFVLEPLYQGVEKIVDVVLQSAFQNLIHIFNTEKAPPFSTKVWVSHETSGSVLCIDLAYTLPYSAQGLNMSFKLSA